MKLKFKKAVIIGPGLIGGSIGINLRKKKIARTIVGLARRKSTLRKAKKRKAIDKGIFDLKKAVNGADLIIIATPVATIKKILIQLESILQKDCIIFDVGSTKKEIVNHAQRILPAWANFIGVHPMAGSEKAGAEFAYAELFQKSICFITKTKKTNRKALKIVENLWRKMGARTIIVSPSVHDRIVAQVSHLPHMVSASLVDFVKKDFLQYAAAGFKDTTRIAAGDPDIWHDISFSNKHALLQSISGFEKKLAAMKKFISKGQDRLLMDMLKRAKCKRDSLFI